MRILNVLVACEESQAICKEFRKLGHNAYSCDLLDCSGGHPEWHFKCDCLDVIANGGGELQNGAVYFTPQRKWDLMIAHPPCTFLTVSGNRWFNVERYGDAALQRFRDRELGAKFFMDLYNAPVDHVAIENPIGVMSTLFRKPDQTIHPWMFGDNFTKNTCLWLRGLPPLKVEITEAPEMQYKEWTDKNGRKKRQNLWYYEAFLNCKTKEERQKIRSKTFPGIARAIAQQWSEYLLKNPTK